MKMIGHSFILAIITAPFAEYMVKQQYNECDGTKIIYTSNSDCSCDSISTSLLNNLEKANFASQTLTGMNDKISQLNEQITSLSRSVSHVVSEQENERKERKQTEKVMNDLKDVIQQLHNETSGHVKNLGKEMKENLNTTQHHFSLVAEKVQTQTNIEIDSMKRLFTDDYYWILVAFVVMVLVVLIVCVCLCLCKEKSKSMLQVPVKESVHQLPKLENTVAVVSFAQANADFHLTIAKSVTEDFKFERIILGGVQNISNFELTSKVAFVFVDKNERNIILETEDDITRTRTNFVQNIIERDNTQVIVIYCQDETSQDNKRLCNSSLGNVQNHKTLRHLKRLNCVLSINREFSEYQRNYLKMFLNETLSE